MVWVLVVFVIYLLVIFCKIFKLMVRGYIVFVLFVCLNLRGVKFRKVVIGRIILIDVFLKFRGKCL